MLLLCRLIALVTFAVMNFAITSTRTQTVQPTTCDAMSTGCQCVGSDLVCTDLGELDEVPDDIRNSSFNRLSFTGRTKIRSIQADAFSGSTLVAVLTLANLGVRSVDRKAFVSIGDNLNSIDLHGNSVQRIDAGTFYGVTSSSLSIDLSSNEISFLASSLVFGDSVTELDLSGNRLRDIEQSTFQLPNLLSLTIASNLLTSLPADVFSGCGSLKTLSLASNLISNVGSFGALSALTYLDLSNNRLSYIQSTAIQSLTSLVYLNVRGNHLLQAVWLRPAAYIYSPQPPAVERLLLDRNRITDLDQVYIIQPVQTMTSLSLAANRISEIPSSYFVSSVHLNYLNLSINNITDINSDSLSNLDSLIFLNLSHNSIADIDSSAFGDLIALKTLDLSHNKLETLDSELFANCTLLTNLNLSDNRLQYLPAGLFRSNRYLVQIDLSRNRLTTVPDNVFSNLQILNSLLLSNNDLSSIDAEAFAGLFNLQTIDLSGNYLTDDVYVNLYGLFNLSTFANPSTRPVVNLKNNRLTNLALVSLSIFDWYPCTSQLQLSGNTITVVSSLNLKTRYTYLPCEGADLSIDLSSNNISTIEPFAFNGNLAQYLQFLNLSQNSLTSINDKMFAGLRYLRTLDLSWNRLSILPDGCFRNVTSVQKLFLNGNLLVSVSTEAFFGLNGLIQLDLSNNQLGDGVYSGLFSGSWSSLADLKLDSNGISYFDVNLFGQTASLTTCSMRNNNISQVANLTEFYSTLKYLDLGQNQIGADFDLGGFLLYLADLLTLKLDGNDIGTGSYDLSSVNLRSLKSVDLSYNGLTSTDLVELSAVFHSINLTSLSLDGNKLDNLSIAALTAASSLNYLSLRDNILGSDALETVANFVKLQTLHLDGNRIDTIPNSTFQWLTDLNELTIGRNQLTELYQLTFDGLEQSCSDLDLSDNQIDIVDPGAITRLRNIAFLDLSGNNINSLDLPPIMDSLQVLKLNNNQFTSFTEEPLQFRSIRSLDASGNRIATFPSELEIYNDADDFYVQAVKLSDNMLDSVDMIALIGSFGCVDVSNNVIKNISVLGSVIGDQTVYVNELDLSGNQLVEISDAIGKNLASTVRQLNIENNNLTSLNWSLPLSGANVLEELLLSGNQISFVGTRFLQQLAEPLLTLDLRNNRLKRLDQTALNVTSGTSSNGGSPSLLLSGNPWQCDCSLEWLRYGWTGAAVDAATCWTPMSMAGQYIVCYSLPTSYNCSADSGNAIETSDNVVNLCTDYATQVNG